ncbi:TPA: site-specific integrase [Enterobacter hormaechei subsp. steigerwaltii]
MQKFIVIQQHGWSNDHGYGIGYSSDLEIFDKREVAISHGFEVNPENAKAGKAIGVALNDTACRVLRDQIGKSSRWVFVHTKPSTRPDKTVTPAVRKMRVDDNVAWRIGLERAGIEDFRFHDLRHTWASWLIQSGVPLSVLQEMGGWESIEMVRRYAHLAPNHLSEHARKIDAIFGNHDTNTTQGENQAGLKLA